MIDNIMRKLLLLVVLLFSYGVTTTFATNANFSGSSLFGCGPMTVNFNDLSTSSNTLVAWFWDF